MNGRSCTKRARALQTADDLNSPFLSPPRHGLTARSPLAPALLAFVTASRSRPHLYLPRFANHAVQARLPRAMDYRLVLSERYR